MMISGPDPRIFWVPRRPFIFPQISEKSISIIRNLYGSFPFGYLTIDTIIFTQLKSQTPDGEPVKYTSCTFKFPNIEVADGCSNLLKTTLGESKY
jgi:hypothetical protein